MKCGCSELCRFSHLFLIAAVGPVSWCTVWQGRKGSILRCWLQALAGQGGLSLFPLFNIIPHSCCHYCPYVQICCYLSCISFSVYFPHSSELHLSFSFFPSSYSPLCTFVRLLSFFSARTLTRKVESTAKAASLLSALLSGSTETPDRRKDYRKNNCKKHFAWPFSPGMFCGDSIIRLNAGAERG